MDPRAFDNLAEETLESLFDALDDAIGDVAEVDYEGGMLTVELDGGRQYVINRHAASQEIWVSSPISGAAHYAFDDGKGAWISTRGGAALHETLAGELAQATGSDVSLD